jgi:hypothetical protein
VRAQDKLRLRLRSLFFCGRVDREQPQQLRRAVDSVFRRHCCGTTTGTLGTECAADACSATIQSYPGFPIALCSGSVAFCLMDDLRLLAQSSTYQSSCS